MVTKVNSAARKATIPTSATVNDTRAEPESLFASMESLLKTHGIIMPSTTRWVVSMVASAVAGGLLGYAGGTLLSYCVAGVLLFSGSALLALLVYIVGILLILLASYQAGKIIGGFILSGDIDRCYENVSNRVSGWFGSAKNKLSSVQS